MPLLTLKNVQHANTGAGTSALQSAGDLFNRAFSSFGKVAKDIHDTDVAQYNAQSNELLRSFTDEITKAGSVDELNQSNILDRISNANLTQEDANTITSTLRNAPQTIEARKQDEFQRQKAQLFRTEEPKINVLKSQIAAITPDSANTVLENISKSGLSAAAQTDLINQANQSLTGAYQRETQAKVRKDRIREKQAGKQISALVTANPTMSRRVIAQKVAKYNLAPGVIAGMINAAKADTGDNLIEAKKARQTKLSEELDLFKKKKRFDQELVYSDPSKLVEMLEKILPDDDWINKDEDKFIAARSISDAIAQNVPINTAFNLLLKVGVDDGLGGVSFKKQDFDNAIAVEADKIARDAAEKAAKKQGGGSFNTQLAKFADALKKQNDALQKKIIRSQSPLTGLNSPKAPAVVREQVPSNFQRTIDKNVAPTSEEELRKLRVFLNAR